VPVAAALFLGAAAMGPAGVCIWAWGVRSGQFRDLEKTKDQIFWPELGLGGGDEDAAHRVHSRP
jgi:cbb3-type cytochrome oxidase maturation protein